MAKDNFPAIPAFPHPLVNNSREDIFVADRQDGICDLERRIPLHAERRVAAAEARHHRHGGHRRPPPGRGRDRSQIRGPDPRSAHRWSPRKRWRKCSASRARRAKTREIEFARDESHLFFRAGERLLISRMLTGQFPNYEAVLPRDNNRKVVIERGELNDAVRRVSQLADTRSHAVKFSVSTRRRRNFRVQPRIRRSQGNHREGIQRRAARHRLQRAVHARFSGRRRRRPHQPRTKRRTIRRADAPPRRRSATATATSSCRCGFETSSAILAESPISSGDSHLAEAHANTCIQVQNTGIAMRSQSCIRLEKIASTRGTIVLSLR